MAGDDQHEPANDLLDTTSENLNVFINTLSEENKKKG